MKKHMEMLEEQSLPLSVRRLQSMIAETEKGTIDTIIIKYMSRQHNIQQNEAKRRVEEI